MASTTNDFAYEVFLSFRGEDTRYGFTGTLKNSLDDKGVRTFFDDEELRKGDEITPSLFKAIEDSKIAIVVLSENYASSSFCLQELTKILDSMKDKGRSVLPVFYKVDPSDIRKLQNTYGKAMAKHKASSNPNIDKWKVSLDQVANLSGFHYKEGEVYEHKFIGTIVEEVLRKIKLVALPVGDYLVGLEPQKEHVTSLLNIRSDDEVNMLGIHGIGGIGKTTLALAVYNLIRHQFQGSCFLEKVRENSEKNGLIYLQEILLSEIVGDKNIGITSVRQGISILQQRLNQKKVLLLLDDVDNEEQLQAIAGKSDWFGLGSRVIITTRDKRLLTCHGIERTYEVKGLNDKDAFELLRWKAFKNEKTNKDFPGYVHVLNRAVTYASGLPLALEVIGSHFFNKTIEQCKCALDRYERVPDKKIQTTLQLSFDALQEEEKFVFLDIACCFKGYKLTRVQQILHAHHGDIMKDHIDVLVEKSLIKISESSNVTLHDLVEDMGKEIVRQESLKDPEKRSRLWASKDINQVLKDNKETSKIEMIYVNGGIEVEQDGKAFNKMENLKTLLIDEQGHFDGSLPNSLRALDCRSFCTSQVVFPNKKLQHMRVLNFGCTIGGILKIHDLSNLPNLDEISIENSQCEFTIDKSVCFLSKLKILRIISCIDVKSVPPLDCPSLVELDLSNCSSLESFPLTVNGFVGNLKILRLINCYKIKIIPFIMLDSLEELNLRNCTSLESFSHVVDWSGDKLKTMNFRSCTNLKTIPPLKLASLEELDLSYCASLKSFPRVVDGFLGKLKTLLITNCDNLKSIPPLKLDSLEKVDFSNCPLLESCPFAVDQFLGKLKTLVATNCHNLRSIPTLKLNSLEELDISHCYFLESFPSDGCLDKLKFLNIEGCMMLRSLPPLRLTLLERFNLSYCPNLERFPEILGEMRNIPQLLLDGTTIKELPFSFENVTQPETFYQCKCGIVGLPKSVAVMSRMAEFSIEYRTNDSPMPSSRVEYICLENCNVSLDYLSDRLLLFANVKELHLTNIQFTVLPESIKECKFLWRLVLDNCKELREIQEIPPCLTMLSALNCKSLTSSSKSKLLNQKLHEAGNTWFLLPEAKIPEWFDHQGSIGFSISFRFRNKFPAIILCYVSPFTWKSRDTGPVPFRVIINGKTFFFTHGLNDIRRTDRRLYVDTHHLHLFHMEMENFKDNIDKALLENKWSHAEVHFGFSLMYSGIHVLKDKSSMEDFQFTNPDI